MSRIVDKLRQAFTRFGVRRVRVYEDEEEKGYFHAEFDAIRPSDRQAISEAIAKKLGLQVEGGGTLLATKTRKALSDVSFSLKRR